MAQKELDETIYKFYGQIDPPQLNILNAALDAVDKPVHEKNLEEKSKEVQIIDSVVKQRTASKGKDLSALFNENRKRKTPFSRSTANNSSDNLTSKISAFNRSEFLSAQERQVYSNDAMKAQKYAEVKAGMEAGLRANAPQPQQAKNKTSEEEIDEDFERWIMAQKTGLDYGYVARKVLAIHKLKGVLFHYIQWENSAASEWIPGKRLQEKFPHVLIEFYESHAYKINITPLIKN